METRDTLTETAINYLRNVAGIIGLFGGISYIAGYLITNFYVGKYGVSTFNLVQSRYFASGALFLILALLIVSGPSIGFIFLDISSKTSTHKKPLRNVILMLLCFLLSALIIRYSGSILVGLSSSASFVVSIEERRVQIWLGLIITGIALLAPVFVIFLVRWISARALKDKKQDTSKWVTIVFTSAFIFFFLIALWLFSQFVYPNASPALGGNAPTKVQLVLSDYLSHIDGFPIQNSEGITEPVILIDETTNSILILKPNSDEAIEIPASEVKGIIR